MCGIIAALTTSVDVKKYLIDGLGHLQNRGYDSAGLSLYNENSVFTVKFASTTNNNALNMLREKVVNLGNSSCGIAHTRWATHGIKSDYNSHPHSSCDGNLTLVHNGIIENYLSLKNELIDEGYTFVSETDTEIIVNLISKYYKITNDPRKSIEFANNRLEGTWGIVVMFRQHPGRLYSTRRGSPIILSHTSEICMISSETSGFGGIMSNYYALNNHDILEAFVKDGKVVIETNNNYTLSDIPKSSFESSPFPYEHWTIKEIWEQVDASERSMSKGGRLMSDNKVKLGGLDSNISSLIDIDNVILLGCGSSYYAGQIGIMYLKDLCNFNTVQIFDGAEFSVNDIPKKGKTVAILLSQSGETKDLHRCISIARNRNVFMIGVVNVVDSLIAREVDCGCYLNAGREVAVASTKSFTSQVMILSMIGVWFSQLQSINASKRFLYLSNMRKLPKDIKNTIISAETSMDSVMKIIMKNSIFILGKGVLEPIAKEGSLKIKELSYTHAEGYSAGSLKHGPFAMLDENTPVILLVNDESLVKMTNVYEEVKSRMAPIIVITSEDLSDRFTCCHKITHPSNCSYGGILGNVILQIISYRMSLEKNINPDYPKNLAKVVTVE